MATERWTTAEILAAGFLPGALAGTQFAGLLFFLNPHLPFSVGPAFKAVALYASALGIVGMLLHVPFTWGRQQRARRALPWMLALVMAATAASAWVHASHYAFFLPPGINRRLLKLAILLTLSAVVAFYTTLLHRLRRRRYGRRSTFLLALLSVLSIYVAFERREAFKTPVVPSPRATTVESEARPRALVIGIESASLDAILPLAEMGRLPFFAQLLADGAYGRLASMTPVARSPLWTTLATGKYPFKHGVVGETLYAAPFAGTGESLTLLPIGVGFAHWGTWPLAEDLDARMVRVQTLWQILSRLGVSTAVVGWPLSAPTPAGVDAVLSDRFFAGASGPGVASPTELGERARLFRPRSEEINAVELARFGSAPPRAVAESLADDLWRASITAFLLDRGEHEAVFVLLPGLGAVSRGFFGGHDAVHFEGLQDAKTEAGARLLGAYYTLLDAWLSDMWQRMAPPRLLIVVSAYGVEAASGWRELRRHLVRAPDMHGYFERGPAGILMMRGDGVRADTVLSHADLVDLAPTLLYGLGNPIADDFDGAVLTGAFDTTFLARHPLSFVPSYETLAAP